MKKTRTRFFSILLTLCMILSLVPALGTTASADAASIKQQIDSGVRDFTVMTYEELVTVFKYCEGDYSVKLGADLKAELGDNGDTTFAGRARYVTFDFNGHTVRVTRNGSVEGNHILFWLKNTVNLTIKDSVGGGGLYMTALRSKEHMFWLKDNAGLTLESGLLHYEVADSVPGVNEGRVAGNVIYLQGEGTSFTMQGGTLESTLVGSDYYHAMIWNTGTVFINGGTLNSACLAIWSGGMASSHPNAETVINGGTFNYVYYAVKLYSGKLKINGGVFNNSGKYGYAVYIYPEYAATPKSSDWLGSGVNVFINSVKTTLKEDCISVLSDVAGGTVIFTTDSTVPPTQVSSVSVDRWDFTKHAGSLDKIVRCNTTGVTVTDIAAYYNKKQIDSFYLGDHYDLYITAKCDDEYVFATGAELLLQPTGGDLMRSSYCVRLSDNEMRFVFEGVMVEMNIARVVTKADIFIPTPVAGATPATAATSYTKNLTISDTVWSPADSVFKDGTDYTVTVTIRAASGYVLPQTVRAFYEKNASPDELAYINEHFDEEFPLTAVVNGKAATIDASKATLSGTKNDADYATAVVYTFTASNAQAISSVAVTGIDTPVMGKTPDTTATVASDAKYTVAAVSWQPDDSPFKADTAYTVLVSLESKDGAKFAADAAVTVNGQTAKVVSGAGSEEMKVSCTFPKTVKSGAPVITVQPKSADVKTGSSVTFTVAATGENLHYQWWQVDAGVPVKVGTDSPSYTIAKTNISDHDCYDFYCVVSNTLGTVTSEKAHLAVSDTPYVFPFTDVPESAWYYESVRGANKMGLINGTSATTYSPGNNMTVCEAMKLAACMHQLYNDGEVTLTGGSPWYKPYYDYCRDNGIISASGTAYEPSYDDYMSRAAKPITRSEYVFLFSRALPDSALPGVNTIPDNSIPDVKLTQSLYDQAIYKMYRAGILCGSDVKGTFNPDNNIQRSEVAAILIRMMDPAARVAAPSQLGQ